jgi:SRSO17 transposase
MPNPALATFALVLSSFRLCFTAPSFVHFVLLVVGWLCATASSPYVCVTNALVAAGVSGKLAWQRFHRFFNRAEWQPDRLGAVVLQLLQPLLSTGLVELVIDDTVAQKKGQHVFGASMHVEPNSSTKKRKNFVHGHCWVVLCVVVNVPWSTRPWAVPLLFRLYRGKREAGQAYRTKSSLAREMLDKVGSWLPKDTLIRLLLDSGYMNRTMLRGLDLGRVTVFGALKTDAALSRAPERPARSRRGRPSKKGKRLPKPSKIHRDRRWKWKNLTATVYQQERTQRVLGLTVQWYGVLGERLNRVFLVDQDTLVRVFLCTDPNVADAALLCQMSRRWSIEVWNKETKQELGFADSPAWSEKAVRRTAPFVGYLTGILVVWFHRLYQQGITAPLPQRPWYAWKENLTLADLARAARETFRGVDVLAWAVAVAAGDLKVLRGAAKEKAKVRCGNTEVAEKRLAA